jgi:hypothetical protein
MANRAACELEPFLAGDWPVSCTFLRVSRYFSGSEQHREEKKMANTSSIREHMGVFGSCGNQLGDVDRVEGNSIKLTKSSSSDGQHHYIPMNWVESVDDKVHLNKDCGEAKKEWKAAP